MKRLLLASALLCSLALTATAQSATYTASKDAQSHTVTTNYSASDMLFADVSETVIYIDFEQLNVNLSDVIVRNVKGEELLRDNVFELPVNTIYELDLSGYPAGTYEIELRSFTGSIRKTVSVR